MSWKLNHGIISVFGFSFEQHLRDRARARTEPAASGVYFYALESTLVYTVDTVSGRIAGHE